jgi:hypothetical protein
VSIATKSELRAALGGSTDSLLHRTYSNAKMDEFILMGESRLNRALRMLDMIQQATGTLSTIVATLALPTRFADKLQFRINDPATELIWVPPSRIKEYVPDLTTSRQPKRYTVRDVIEFDAIPDSAYAYTLTYYQGYKLTADADTNYVLTNYPQAYLYASAIDAFIYQRNIDMAQTMTGLLRAELATIKAAERHRKGQDDARLETDFNQRERYSIDQG